MEKHYQELTAAGISVIASSVDPLDKAQEVADEVSYPIGYGITREQADQLGSWWEDNRQIIQPTELVLRKDGSVVSGSYSSGPLARIDPQDVIKMVKYLESMQNK